MEILEDVVNYRSVGVLLIQLIARSFYGKFILRNTNRFYPL